MGYNKTKQELTRSRLIDERNRKGLSQEELAERLREISLQSIKNYERQLSNIGASNLCALADFYEVSVDYLLGRTDHRTPDMEFRAMSEKLGLSESSIMLLHFKQYENILFDRKYILDRFIQGGYFGEIIECIGKYLESMANSYKLKVIPLTELEKKNLKGKGYVPLSYHQESSFHLTWAQHMLAMAMEKMAKEDGNL